MNTIRELEQQEKYKNMLKRKNKEINRLNKIIYKLEEVEILDEPKKIEKIEMCTGGIMSFDSVENITTELKNKINELIDEINDLKENL